MEGNRAGSGVSEATPAPERVLRPYQEAAIAAWRDHGYHGIFAMATGTGKTYTAIVAVERLLAARSDLDLVVIAAPFQHLVDQWADELDSRGVRAFRAFEDTARWLASWGLQRRGDRALGLPTYLLTTYVTLSSEPLLQILSAEVERLVLVADECHYLGARRGQLVMSLAVPARLGLSATPSRHFDEAGTEALLGFFGGIVQTFDLVDAIRAGFLTPYDYFPEAVSLTDAEFDEYRELTRRLSIAAARANAAGTRDDPRVEALARQRSRLLNNAEAKVDWLRAKLAQRDAKTLRHTLVYVGDLLFDTVLDMIGRELGIAAHAFTSEETRRERVELLRRFEAGELSILVAMKCLDEGVDVPPTRSAYFLASSSNPREFVQRRGRILRRSPGKDCAAVYDAIAVPPRSGVWDMFDKAERAAIRTQFSRIREFGQQARNTVAAERAVMALRLAADLPIESAPREGIR